jgi:Cys-tRNA(Pro)/Cys-tRNA(Cys) deacylase
MREQQELSPIVSPVQVLRLAGVVFTLTTHAPIVGQADAEQELKLPTEHLLKTMVFRTEQGAFILAALPASKRVSYGKLAKAVTVPRGQLKQAAPDDLRLLGMELGGASPVCAVDGVVTVFDSFVCGMGKVYCGSGRADQTVQTEARTLIELVQPLIASIVAD